MQFVFAEGEHPWLAVRMLSILCELKLHIFIKYLDLILPLSEYYTNPSIILGFYFIILVLFQHCV